MSGQRGDAAADLELNGEADRQAPAILGDPDADGAAAAEHTLGGGAFHSRLQHAGPEAAERGLDWFASGAVDGQLVELVVKKHEGVPLTAGLEVPVARPEQPEDHIGGFARRERQRAAGGGRVVGGPQGVSGRVVEGDLMGALLAPLAGFLPQPPQSAVCEREVRGRAGLEGQ